MRNARSPIWNAALGPPTAMIRGSRTHASSEALMRIRKLFIAALLISGATVWASDYLTEGADPARSGWMKDEKVFTTANVTGMKLLWQIKLESTPREMHNLFPPLVAERVTTPQGPREMAVVAGVSDDLF